MHEEQRQLETGPVDSRVEEGSDDAAAAEERKLSTVQEKALQHLTSGSGVVEAAKAAGVHRRTVWRWMHADPHFIAAYNAWQREVVASGRARVLAMTDLALDTVQSAMQQGNARIALQVAKATGAMDAPRPGTAEAELVRRQHQLREGNRRLALEAAERKYKADSGSDGSDDRYYASIENVVRFIDFLLVKYRENLARETPEDRAKRMESYNPHARTMALLEPMLSAPDCRYGKRFDYYPLPPYNFGPPPSSPESLLSAGAAGTSAAGPVDSVQSGAGAPDSKPSVITPSAEPTALSGAPTATKAIATRVVSSERVSKIHRPYNPDAIDPLDSEPWVDL